VQIQEIETYLQALDEELAQQKIRKPVRLVVVGGVYMMLVLGNRSSTKDVDIIPLDFPDTTNPNKETKAFRSAINAVAKRFGIRRDWMNDVVSAFIPDLGPVTVWREYQHLHVYVPSQEYILVFRGVNFSCNKFPLEVALVQGLHMSANDTRTQSRHTSG